jgi:LysR family nitrogen assimilation transcriptional regulator
MDIATLTIGLTVLHEGSIRTAARVLRRPPASVSDGLERFERGLAARLVDRSRPGFSITLAGETLLRDAHRVVAGIDALARLARCPPEGTRIWAAAHAIPLARLSLVSAVARSGSIRGAAKEAGVGQPHLSRQIARLERQLGRPVLNRSRRGSELTGAGQRLGSIAQSLTEALDDLRPTPEGRVVRASRLIRLGTVIPIGPESRLAGRLARLLAEWRRIAPSFDLLISSATAEDLLAGLRAGQYDMCLLDAPVRHRRLDSRDLFSAELVLVGAKGLFVGAPPALDLLHKHVLAVPSQRSGLRQSIRDVLDTLLAGKRQGALEQVEVDALPIILNLVLEHGYVAVLPRDAISSQTSRLDVLPLPGRPAIHFRLVWPRMAVMKQVADLVELGLQ